MNIEIPKGTFDTPAPCWIPVTRDGKNAKPVIRCQCGKYTGIGLHHVHADGKVTASFFHQKCLTFTHNGKEYPGDPNGCGWHVYLQLLNYDKGDFPSEP